MTENELVETLSKKGFTETTISKVQNERIFTATDIYGNEITITFDKGKDSYDKVSMKGLDRIIQTPIDVDIKQLNAIDTGSPNLMDTGDKSNERADAEDWERFKGISLTAYTIDKITFDTEAFEEFKNIIVVDIDDIKKLHKSICDACSYFTGDISKSLNNVETNFDSLNKLTMKKARYEWDDKITNLKKETSNINSSFNNIISNLKDIIAKDEETDGGKKGSTRYTRPIDEITPVEPTIPVDLDNLNKLTPAIAGAITFTEVISMYTSIGSETIVKSSLTGNYGLLGLIHQNDKYYYKIIDKATGQVYFVEVNDKSKIEWDERGERKAVEVVGDGANILKLPQEGDVLVRNPEVGDVYFLNGEKMTFDGIDYYFISDNVTGEVGYIPVNTSLSEPVLVSALGGIPTTNSSSEVIK